MVDDNTLLVYEELGVLKFSTLHEKPFFSIPTVIASKEGTVAFGNEALEKDQSWQLTWIQCGNDLPAHMKRFDALYDFVFQQPDIVKAVAKCNRILRVYPNVQVSQLDERYFSDYDSIFGYVYPPIREIYAETEDILSLCGREVSGKRFVLNISTESTWIRRGRGKVNSFNALSYIKVGFDTIVNLFIKLLCEKGYDFTAQQDRLFCHKLVMDYCYVALDFEKELERIENLDGPLHEITLEDGTVLELGKECIIAPEVLFNPGLVGMDGNSIMTLFQRAEFFALGNSPCIIFVGGCAPALKGLGERIQLELEKTNTRYIDNPIDIIKTNIREDLVRFAELIHL